MREHLIEKYFCYRRRCVDHIVAEAPQRALLAVFAEAARLTFVASGAALCALILWFLTAGALTQRGGPSGWAIAFALLATLATIGAFDGIVNALRDRGRIAAQVQRSATAADHNR
jgi:hypothetical protein